MYKTFVRPKLEFGVAAWAPWTEADTKCLEKVQERLVRMLSDVSGNDYEDKLDKAGLTTLKERRNRGDAIEVYKELRRKTSDSEGWFKLVDPEARPLRSNATVENGNVTKREKIIEIERANLEVRKNSFVVRAARIWNDLPDIVKEQGSVNSFKNAYDTWKRNRDTTNITQLCREEAVARE